MLLSLPCVAAIIDSGFTAYNQVTQYLDVMIDFLFCFWHTGV